ncbi:SRPBCC family protein [Aestuariivirga sp.]|uniref:SRPBCC family protein n=1 Tax=Aestuariivirga sp. TaxID=2650926 RepID=UPI00391ABF30
MRFHHHMVHVRDLPRATRFYCDALHLEPADRHSYDGTELVYLRGRDGIEVELIRPASWTFDDGPSRGHSHIAFTVEDLAREHARLAECGLSPGPIADYVAEGRLQTRFFYLHDPEGNEIEFLQGMGRYARAEGNTAMPLTNPAGSGFTEDAARSFTPDASFYFDEAVYKAELRGIFSRSWLYFCHGSELPEPGDYVTGEIAGQSVYVIRGRDGMIRGFFNVCQHRAHQLLTGSGNVKNAIRCPYHSWTYEFDGALRGAPKCEEVEGFDRASVRLAQIGVDVIGGFVFVNLDKSARPLRESVPHFGEKLLAMCPEAERLRFVKRQDFAIRANWKVVVENFLENYHSFYSGPAHRQLSDVIDQDTYRWSIEGKVIEFLGRGGSAERLPYAMRGERRFTGRNEGFQIVFLWPNMAFLILPGANMLLVFLMNPDGAEKTAEPLLYFGLDGGMDEGTESAVEWFNDILGPEDVELVESVQRGLHSMGYTRGRLMVDPGQKEAWSEHFIHHFNQLNVKAITAAA